MLKQYIYKITKEQRVFVTAENEEDAYERARESSLNYPEDEEITDIELLDVCDEDVDFIGDDYRISNFIKDETDYDEEDEMYYDEKSINRYFYGG